MTKWHQCSLLIVICWLGCSVNPPGTEIAARKHFDAEFKKWMAGEKNEVSTLKSRGNRLKEPISYDIRSVVKGDPDVLAYKDNAQFPDDWKTWPAYKLNVAIEWKSQAGTPLTDIATYTMTWNTAEKRWYVTERH